MPNYIDKYFDNVEAVQTEMLSRLKRLIPKLQKLNTSELIEVARSIDFLQEMNKNGLGDALDNLYNSFNGEVSATLKKASTLGVKQITTTNIQAIEAMRLLEVDSLLKGYEQYASDLKRELIRGIITGEEGSSLAARLTNDFGAEKMLTGPQKRVVVNDAFSRLSNATTKEVFADTPEQKFEYIGPNDDVTRIECSDVLSDSRNSKGFTTSEIDGLPVDFASRGGWNCRHDWVPV